MNIRHAAALALVGWYLMAPPFHHKNTGVIDSVESEAPLSTWTLIDSFDTAAECRSGHEKNIAAERLSGQSSHLSPEIEAVRVLAAFHAQCIATDDPRLKEK